MFGFGKKHPDDMARVSGTVLGAWDAETQTTDDSNVPEDLLTLGLEVARARGYTDLDEISEFAVGYSNGYGDISRLIDGQYMPPTRGKPKW